MGAFGRVFVAFDDLTERCVAIKVLTPQKKGASILHEARCAARLDHENIVRVYSVDVTEEGDYFVVMELLDGGSLAHVLRKNGPLPTKKALQVMIRVAAAVQHAHESGLIHRDIKPDNILFDGSGTPHVADFGLAVSCTDLLRNGELSGTPHYMSPEQVLGDNDRLDGRTDVWSLGVVFYEMLTARRPFSGATPKIVFDNVLSRDATPIRQFCSKVEPEVQDIIAKCLQKEREQRFESAADMALALRTVVRRKRLKRRSVFVLVVTLSLAFVTAVPLIMPRSGEHMGTEQSNSGIDSVDTENLRNGVASLIDSEAFASAFDFLETHEDRLGPHAELLYNDLGEAWSNYAQTKAQLGSEMSDANLLHEALAEAVAVAEHYPKLPGQETAAYAVTSLVALYKKQLATVDLSESKAGDIVAGVNGVVKTLGTADLLDRDVMAVAMLTKARAELRAGDGDKASSTLADISEKDLNAPRDQTSLATLRLIVTDQGLVDLPAFESFAANHGDEIDPWERKALFAQIEVLRSDAALAIKRKWENLLSERRSQVAKGGQDLAEAYKQLAELATAHADVWRWLNAPARKAEYDEYRTLLILATLQLDGLSEDEYVRALASLEDRIRVADKLDNVVTLCSAALKRTIAFEQTITDPTSRKLDDAMQLVHTAWSCADLVASKHPEHKGALSTLVAGSHRVRVESAFDDAREGGDRATLAIARLRDAAKLENVRRGYAERALAHALAFRGFTYSSSAQHMLAQSQSHPEVTKHVRQLFDLAMRNFDESIRIYGSYEAYTWRGSAYNAQKEYVKGIEDFTASIRIRQDNNAFAYDGRGFARFQLGRFAAAIDDYSKAIRQSHNNPKGLQVDLAIVFRAQGDCCEALADFGSAEVNYDKALEYVDGRPDLAEELRARIAGNRAMALAAKGNVGEALSVATDNVGRHPKNADAYAARAFVHFKRGEFREAIADCDAAIKIDPANAVYHVRRGMVNTAVDNVAAAIKDYSSAIALKEDFSEALKLRAKAYENRGAPGDAAMAQADREKLRLGSAPAPDEFPLVEPPG